MKVELFSWRRLWAIVTKEFIQMKRDRATFAMIVGVPLLQLILFGYAINTNPKHLPTVVVATHQDNFTRTFLQSLKDTTYFRFIKTTAHEAEAKQLLATGQAQFMVDIPPDFSESLIHGEHPNILITADATDSVATANALGAANILSQQVFNPLLTGPLTYLKPQPTAPPFYLIVHAKYNPELVTQYNIVPGLLGTILTMTLVIITALGITRERERGTLENLLVTPARPIEVMIGKVLPYIIVGYIQMLLILGLAYYLFHIPMHGSILLLFLISLPFIAANLSVGVTFSSMTTNQLQATQMAFFFFLPSILLSGFMFPFYGMPLWAQKVGGILPLTYFLRITRGILLKGNSLLDIWPNTWPILIFMVIALAIGLIRYRKTLD